MRQVLPPLPTGSCDAHMHLYAPGPHLRDAPFAVPDGKSGRYRELMTRLGILLELCLSSRCSTARTTTSCSEDLRRWASRSPAVTRADAPGRLWGDLALSRAFMMPGGIFAWEELPRLRLHSPIAAGKCNCRWMGVRSQRARRCCLTCHAASSSTTSASSSSLIAQPSRVRSPLRLVANGRVWIKLSGLYETSRSCAPGYSDVAVLARRSCRGARSDALGVQLAAPQRKGAGGRYAPGAASR